LSRMITDGSASMAVVNGHIIQQKLFMANLWFYGQRDRRY
jgi:hypothetical protein